MLQTDTKVEPKPEEQSQPVIDFGDGRYSNAMRELFSDSKSLLKITDKQAEKLASSFGAELGKFNVGAKITYGRYSAKSNQITLKESATFKGLTVTFAISLAKLCVLLQDATIFGLDPEKSVVELKKNWIDWLNK